MSIEARLTRLERKPRRFEPAIADAERFAWYGESCPCGLPPGECQEHPRARSNQRPPDGDWRCWYFQAGRGAGKSRSGAEFIRNLVETGQARKIALVGPTNADTRDTMVLEGLLQVCPPWFRPTYQPSMRRVIWPNGARAMMFSSQEPDRLRGPQHDAAWCDEVGAWDNAQRTWDMLMFALRTGSNPRVVVTSTPRSIPLLKTIKADPATTLTRGRTYDNRRHLAPQFFDQIIRRYEGTRLGEQEIEGEELEISEGQWFSMFRRNRHVSEAAEFTPLLPVFLAVDCGVSRWTGALLYQFVPIDRERVRMHVVADYLAVDLLSEENAQALMSLVRERTNGQGDLEAVLIDPAAGARTGVGPAAEGEYQRVFGRRVRRWPLRGVLDSLNQVETLLGPESRPPDVLVHPRCTTLIAAFFGYRRAEKNGEYLDVPVSPNHPHEEAIDCLRGAIADKWPEGRRPQPNYPRM